MLSKSQSGKAGSNPPDASRLQFIESLLEFGRSELDLDFAGSFATVDDSAHYANWLYVSHAGRIESALKRRSRSARYNFSWDKRLLERSGAAYRGLGYDTYLFSAEGHGGGECPITPALLTSSPARSGYVVIHEGWHSTLAKEKISLPYPVEEATGRVIGCFGIIEFARKHSDGTLLARSLAQERDWALFAGFVNRWHRRLSNLYSDGGDLPALKAGLFSRVRADAEKLARKMKTYWERKELQANINNAFFLRYYSYTHHYPAAARAARAAGGLRRAVRMFKELGQEKKPVRALGRLARMQGKAN